MLITVTLNPAMDRTLLVNSFSVNSVSRGVLLTNAPGGKGINVSRAALELGGKTLALCIAGGETGRLFTEKLGSEGIDFQVMNVKGETRTCYGIIDKELATETVINELGPSLEKNDVEKFKSLFSETVKNGDIVALSGSFPIGMPDTIYAELIEIVRANNARVILDTSGVGLRKGLEAGPFIVKVNRLEIAQIDGSREPLEDNKLIDIAKSLISRWGISNIIVTQGNGPVFIISASDVFVVVPPDVSAVNTWGSGDCVVAGLLVYLDMGHSFEDAVRLGVAAGTANTLSYGAGFIKIEDVMALYKKTTVTHF